MKILVVGRQGQVAQSIAAAGIGAGLDVVALGRPELDLTAPDSVEVALAGARPDIVVNAAAYTAVDKAEQERDAAFAINAHGPERLAQACAAAGLPLVHISTDYVFDGSKPTPYAESDPTAPLGVYGSSKLAGEHRIAAVLTEHVILRTAWVVSPYGNNFVKTMLRLAETRDSLGVVDDQLGSPTYAPHLAEAILAVARRTTAEPGDGIWGTYHAAGSGEATWCEVAREVFRCSVAAGDRPCEAKAITTADYPTPARRPANSRLDCSKLKSTFGIALPDWRQGIDACVGALLRDSDATNTRRAR